MNRMKAGLEKFSKLYEAVMKRDETKIVNIRERPEYAWHYHAQFYGKDLPLELTREKYGFIIRGTSPDSP